MTKRRIKEAEVNRREARKRSGATAGHLHHLVHVLEVHEGQDHIVVADEGEGQGNDCIFSIEVFCFSFFFLKLKLTGSSRMF